MGAMLQMMQEMMGKGEKPGKKPGENPGDKPGDGGKGDTDLANDAQGGKATGKSGERRVPKSAGKSGTALPPEFQKALDAYNKSESKK